MVETTKNTPEPARKDRPRNGRDTRFKPKNAGKPKGAKDRRRVLGQEAARALEAGAWSVIERLLTSSSWRARHEAAKVILSYSIGMPVQSIAVRGGLSDLAGELTRALAAARLRRAQLDAPMAAQGLLAQPQAIPAGAEIVADMPVDVPVNVAVDGAEIVAGLVKGEVAP